MINAFVSGATTIQFNTPHDRDSTEDLKLIQTTALDSAGNRYTYFKGNIYRTTYSIIYPHVTDAILTTLRTFFTTTVQGSKTLFTWWDHAGVAHTVRFATSTLKYTQIGPSQHRIELQLEEDLAATLPAVTTWNSAKDLKAGSAPVWILRLTINSVDYYLSGSAFNVPNMSAAYETPGWPFGVSVTTLAWIAELGPVRSSISGANLIGEYRVDDLDTTILIDPTATPNFKTLIKTYPVEQSPAELYLWFIGLPNTVTPRLMFRGYVTDVPEISDTAVKLIITDETSRLQAYAGRKVNSTDFPYAPQASLACLIPPAVYGSIAKMPTICLRSPLQLSLTSDITSSIQTIPLSSGLLIAVNTIITIDAEDIKVLGVTGNSITSCTRGYNIATGNIRDTIAQSHVSGTLVWDHPTTIDYIVMDGAVSAINKVYTKHSTGDFYDLTAFAARYVGSGTSAVVAAGQLGGQHPSYPGKAIVTVGTVLSIDTAVSGGVAQKTIVNPDTVSNAVGWSVGTALPINAIDGNNASYAQGGGSSQCYFRRVAAIANISSLYAIRIGVTYSNSAGGDTLTIYINGGYTIFTPPGTSATSTVYSPWQSFSNSSDIIGTNTYIALSTAGAPEYFSIWWELVAITSNIVPLQISGIPYMGILSAINGNVDNALVDSKLYIDAVGGSSSPSLVFADLLTKAGFTGTFQVSGSLPGSYTLNGIIDRYETFQYWLDFFSFQLRSWFRISRGVATLMVRSLTITSMRTLPACMLDDNERSLKMNRSDVNQIINRLNLLYSRDWSQDRSDTSYKGLFADNRTTSQGQFGICEQPDQFLFDFVIADAHASDVGGFYLDYNSVRHWVYTFELFLDESDLLFGNMIQLGFEGGDNCVIDGVEIAPGNSAKMDTIKVIAVN